jgi:hypothetical protein
MHYAVTPISDSMPDRKGLREHLLDRCQKQSPVDRELTCHLSQQVGDAFHRKNLQLIDAEPREKR